MMSELAKRLQRRAAAAEEAPAKPAEESAQDGEESGSSSRAVASPTSPAIEQAKTLTPSSWVPKSQRAPAAEPVAEAAPARKWGAKGAAPGFSEAELGLFKSALLNDFRAELGAVKQDIIASLRQEIANLP